MPRLTPPNLPAQIQAEGYRADILPAAEAFAVLVGMAKHKTSARMATRMERFAADVAAAREQSMQASVPAAVSVGREAKERA